MTTSLDQFLPQCTDGSSTFSSRYITVSDGSQLRLIEFSPGAAATTASDAPWLVFLPGWLSHIRGWPEFLREITPHFRVLYLESREKGSSIITKKSAEFTVERLTQDAVEAIEQLIPAGQAWFLAGSSLGATVALEYLDQAKNQPNHSFLISPNMAYQFPGWSIPIINHLPTPLFPAFRVVIKWYLRNSRLNVKEDPDQYDKYCATLDAADPDKLRPNAQALRHYQAWDVVRRIKAAVTIVTGASDKIHGPEELEKAVKLMPAARLELMASNKATHSDEAGKLLATLMKKASQASTVAEAEAATPAATKTLAAVQNS